MDASGVLDVLGVLTDVSGVVDEVAVSVSKFVENVVDRVVVGTPELSRPAASSNLIPLKGAKLAFRQDFT